MSTTETNSETRGDHQTVDLCAFCGNPIRDTPYPADGDVFCSQGCILEHDAYKQSNI